MHERRQEKIGWVGGWLGGFVWVLLLSVMLLVRGETLPAVIGLLIFAMACAAIGIFAPWRHPLTTYRRLLAPLYMLFFCAVGWGVWSFGGPRQIGLNSWWSLLIVMPLMMPLWMGGKRRWQDTGAQQTHVTDGTSRHR
jgi:hypothetical protein